MYNLLETFKQVTQSQAKYYVNCRLAKSVKQIWTVNGILNFVVATQEHQLRKQLVPILARSIGSRQTNVAEYSLDRRWGGRYSIGSNNLWLLLSCGTPARGFALGGRGVIPQRRSVANNLMFLPESVCLWVYLCINTITSERVNIGWWNLGGRCIVQKSRSSNLAVIKPRQGAQHSNIVAFCSVAANDAKCKQRAVDRPT